MDELEETIVYDAMRAIMDNSKALCEMVNSRGSEAEKKAYRDGVYSPAIKLQVILGTDGIDRGNKRWDEMREKAKQAVARALSLPSNPKADPAAAESASTPDVAGSGPASCWTEGQ